MKVNLNISGIVKIFVLFALALVPVFGRHITASAYTAFDENNWRNTRAADSYTFQFKDADAIRDKDLIQANLYNNIFLGSIYSEGDCFWRQYVSFDLEFRFECRSYVFPYQHTYVDYRFQSDFFDDLSSGSNVYPSSYPYFSNFNVDYTIDINGIDYAAEYPVGYLERDSLSPIVTTTVVTVTAHCSGYINYSEPYTVASGTYTCTIRPVLKIVRWDCYDYTDDDILVQINRKVDELSQGDLGIAGIIQDQTGVIEQGNQIQQGIKDELSSSGNIDNSGLQSGFADYQQSEDALIGDSMTQLDSVDFDNALPSSLGASMVASFTFISGLMERLYLLTDFGALFNITAVLLLACVIVGLQRLWK